MFMSSTFNYALKMLRGEFGAFTLENQMTEAIEIWPGKQEMFLLQYLNFAIVYFSNIYLLVGWLLVLVLLVFVALASVQ